MRKVINYLQNNPFFIIILTLILAKTTVPIFIRQIIFLLIVYISIDAMVNWLYNLYYKNKYNKNQLNFLRTLYSWFEERTEDYPITFKDITNLKINIMPYDSNDFYLLSEFKKYEVNDGDNIKNTIKWHNQINMLLDESNYKINNYILRYEEFALLHDLDDYIKNLNLDTIHIKCFDLYINHLSDILVKKNIEINDLSSKSYFNDKTSKFIGIISIVISVILSLLITAYGEPIGIYINKLVSSILNLQIQ